jgi:seryl-tRNA synthetase
MPEPAFDLPGGESTAAALRRTEQERDRLAAAVDDLHADLANAQQECDEAHATGLAYTEKLLAERDLARAELKSARQELDAIRRREAGAT